MLSLGHIGLHIDAKAVALLITIFALGAVFGTILFQTFNNNSNQSVQDTNDANQDSSGPTIGFMAIEEVKVTNVAFGGDSNDHIEITMKNTGKTAITITEIKVNTDDNLLNANVVLDVNEQDVKNVTLTFDWEEGNSYQSNKFKG